MTATEPADTAPAVFISGSISITRLPPTVCLRLANIAERRMRVMVGDARGVDAAVQRFFADRNVPNVTVYCGEGGPRNRLYHWPTRVVVSDAAPGTRAYHAAKDREMARAADFGLIVWDGSSPGSLANIHRLCARGRIVVIYLIREEKFVTLRSHADRQTFTANHPCRGL